MSQASARARTFAITGTRQKDQAVFNIFSEREKPSFSGKKTIILGKSEFEGRGLSSYKGQRNEQMF